MRVRRLALAITLPAVIAGLSGCNTSALSKQELVVYFGQDAPQSDHLAALNACAHATPEATPEPMATDTATVPSDAIGDVRFRIDHADDKQIALLTECLNKQPGVVGVDTPDLTD